MKDGGVVERWKQSHKFSFKDHGNYQQQLN